MGSKSSGVGKQIPTEHLPAALRAEIRRKPAFAWFKLTDVYDVAIEARVSNGNRLALQTKPLMEFAVVEKGAGVDAAWKSLSNRGFKMIFPRLLLRNAAHKRLHLPSAVRLGIDGLLEAEVTAAAETKDGFELPEDG
jgi:hypothetical protein